MQDNTTRTLDQILEERSPSLIERLANLLHNHRLNVNHKSSIANAITKGVNSAIDFINKIAINPQLGAILPTELQEKYTAYINANPLTLTVYSLGFGLLTQLGKYSISVMLASNNNGELSFLRDVSSSGISAWVYFALIDMSLRTSYVLYSRRPIPALYVELPYRIGKEILK